MINVNPNRPRGRAAIALGTVLAALLSGTFAGQANAFPPPDPPEHKTKVTITEPTDGTQVIYGGFFQDVHFAAKATTTFGSCCTYKWTSNLDGVLQTTKTFDHAFATPGTRTVTVTATSSQGVKDSATVKVTAKNLPPTVSIVKVPASPVYSNVSYKFQGDSSDANEFLGLPCSSLKWSTSPVTAPQPPAGCGTVVKFPAAGTYQVRLNAKDAYGLPAPTAIKTVTVKDKPKNTPPSVAVVQPDDGNVLDPGTTYALKALGSDVDNDPITYKWTLTDDTTTKVIGNAATIPWRPANDVPFNCGGRTVTLTVTATDDDGSQSDSIADRINWGPC
jgi:PKD repeat protein